jgi:hypothetical protein
MNAAPSLNVKANYFLIVLKSKGYKRIVNNDVRSRGWGCHYNRRVLGKNSEDIEAALL